MHYSFSLPACFLLAVLLSACSYSADEYAPDTDAVVTDVFAKLEQSTKSTCPNVDPTSKSLYTKVTKDLDVWDHTGISSALSDQKPDMTLGFVQLNFPDGVRHQEITRIRVSRWQRSDGILSAFSIHDLASRYRWYDSKTQLWSNWILPDATQVNGIPYGYYLLLHFNDGHWELRHQDYIPLENTSFGHAECAEIPAG